MDRGRSRWMTAALGGKVAVGVPGSRQPRPPAAARIPPLPEAEWTAEQRALVAKVAPKGDADSALRTLVRVPALVQGVMPYTTYLHDRLHARRPRAPSPDPAHRLVVRQRRVVVALRVRVDCPTNAAAWRRAIRRRVGATPTRHCSARPTSCSGCLRCRRRRGASSRRPTTCTASWTSSRP